MEQINDLIEKLRDKSGEESYQYADQLAAIGTPEVIDRMFELLREKDAELVYLAGRTLAAIEDNQAAIDPLMDLIHDRTYADSQGTLTEALAGFDLSEHFVDILRIYLNGNFKASGLAKWHLDFSEFNISPRTIKKAEKHWKHFEHNSPHDERYEEKRKEVQEILDDLKNLIEE